MDSTSYPSENRNIGKKTGQKLVLQFVGSKQTMRGRGVGAIKKEKGWREVGVGTGEKKSGTRRRSGTAESRRPGGGKGSSIG